MWWTKAAEPRAAALVLTGAVLVVWLPSLGASFQFDDWNVVVSDSRVQDVAAWWASMPGIRPLTKLSYAIDHQLGFGTPGFRTTNVLLHIGCVLLAWSLLRRLGAWAGLDAVRADLAALIAAAAFALHPVQTETITYVSGRSGALAALFSLASLLTWLSGRERRDALRCRVVSPLLFAAAIAAKEVALVLPLTMLLAENLRVRGPRRAGPAEVGGTRGFDRLAADLAPHFALLAVLAVLVLAWPPYRRLLEASLAARPALANLLTQANGIVWLLQQLAWPWRSNADPHLPVITRLDLRTAAQGVTLVAIIVVALLQSRRRPVVAFGLLWFYVWLAPTNSVLARLDVVNERQLYLALLGPAWLLALVVSQRLMTSARAAMVACLLLAALGTLTQSRNRVYASEVTFWEDAAAKSPFKARTANNLGYAYALACRGRDAEREFERALALQPDYVKAAVNLRLLREDALMPRGCERR